MTQLSPLYVHAFSGADDEWRNNFSERQASTIKKSKTGSVELHFGPQHSSNHLFFHNISKESMILIFHFSLVCCLPSESAYFVLLFCLFSKNLIDKSSRRNADRFRRSKIDLDTSEVTDVNNYR